MRFIVFVLFLLVISMPAYACKCSVLSQEYGLKTTQKADIIIKGEITSVSHGLANAGPIIKIKPLEIIKGDIDLKDIIRVTYNSNLQACGHSFTEGQTGTWGLYDTRGMPYDVLNRKGYGFRMMTACDQNQIQNYIQKEGN
jgi:hypothetical protein